MIEHANTIGRRSQPLIAIVDDDPADVHALKHAFKNVGDDVDFLVSDSGSDFINKLDAIYSGSDQLCPDIVFLDINMPGMTGFDTLAHLRQQKHGKTVPIIIYSTTTEKSDVEKAYELGANCFVTKPSSLSGLRELVQRLTDFWFQSASLPSRAPVIN